MNNQTKSARSRFLVVMVLAALLAVAGCGGGEKTDSKVSGSSAADAPAPAANPIPAASGTEPAGRSLEPGKTVLAGVTFSPPAQWRDIGPDGMRQAQYRIYPVAGDEAEAEVNVFYFGPTSGGGVEANLDRWIGQMVLPEGADPATAVARSTFTADGMAGHLVAVNGSYKSGGGRPMGGSTTLLPNYRLVGVVLEGPEGSLFFKLTGPEATVKSMEDDLLTMVKSARK